MSGITEANHENRKIETRTWELSNTKQKYQSILSYVRTLTWREDAAATAGRFQETVNNFLCTGTGVSVSESSFGGCG